MTRAPGGSSPTAAALLLGFALGGFFDGVLLHQVLQWHHLLSGLDDRAGDLAFQVAVDGWFHAGMYVLLVGSLFMLWRSRARLAAMKTGVIQGWALIGFGAWHVVDGLLSHWTLQIHRIKMDAASPLFWDLVWLVAFGLVPIVLGLWRLSAPGARPGAAAAVVLAGLAVGAGALASKPPPGQNFTVVVFGGDLTPREAFVSAAAAGEAVVWLDEGGRVLVISGARPGASLKLYRSGAILVAGGALPAGCFSWSDELA